MKLQCVKCGHISAFESGVDMNGKLQVSGHNCPKCGHDKFNGPVYDDSRLTSTIVNNHAEKMQKQRENSPEGSEGA